MKHDMEIVLKKLDDCSLPKTSKMIKGVPLDVLDAQSMLESVRILQVDDSPKYDVLQDFYEAVDAEKMELIKDVSRFYFTKSNFEEYSRDGLAPKDIWKMIVEKIVRIQRLIMVYEPDYYYSQSPNKQKGEKYDMVKINWIDDNGGKFRKVTKTYGKLGQKGLEFAMPKLLETYFDNLKEYKFDHKLPSGLILDLVAAIGDRQWAFEFKATNKKNFIDTGVRLELWKWYRETYKE